MAPAASSGVPTLCRGIIILADASILWAEPGMPSFTVSPFTCSQHVPALSLAEAEALCNTYPRHHAVEE